MVPHLRLVPLPEPAGLLPAVPANDPLPRLLLDIYLQHTGTAPVRCRHRRRQITRPFQMELPIPGQRSKPKSIGAKPVGFPVSKGMTKKQRRKAAKLAARRSERLRLMLDGARPKTRADCKEGIRPCPWVSCRSNLFLDVKGRNIKLNFPHLEPHQMAESCYEDVLDRYPDGITLERVGRKLNLTMERVRQVEETALEKVQDAGELYGFELTDGEDGLPVWMLGKAPRATWEQTLEDRQWLRELVWAGCSCDHHGPSTPPCSVIKALRALGVVFDRWPGEPAEVPIVEDLGDLPTFEDEEV